jgi:hypothetical protein
MKFWSEYTITNKLIRMTIIGLMLYRVCPLYRLSFWLCFALCVLTAPFDIVSKRYRLPVFVSPEVIVVVMRVLLVLPLADSGRYWLRYW